MQEHSEANQRWNAQLEGFQQSNSYRESLGIDGEPIEFEWNIFPGLTSLEILQKTQKDLHCLRMMKDGSSSCQCSMTSIGQTEEIQKSVFRFPNKSRRITRRGSREDTGHSWAQVMNRNGTELSATHPEEDRHRDGETFQRNWSPSIQRASVL